MIPQETTEWRKVATLLHEGLSQINQALSQVNVPISTRTLTAFDIIQQTMLKVSDYRALLRSSAHGAFSITIGDWYRDRYGDAVDEDTDRVTVATVIIHRNPFAMRIPKDFNTPADEPGTVWISFPASVQH